MNKEHEEPTVLASWLLETTQFHLNKTVFPGSLSVNEGRAVDIIYLYFRMAFDTITHQILIEKLMKYRSDEQPVSMRWNEN